MTRGSVQVGGKMMEVATVRITDTGKDALVSEDCSTVDESTF